MSLFPNTDSSQGLRERLLSFFSPAQKELSQKRDRSFLVWSFLIPLSVMLIIYVLDEVFPFGEKSVLVLDANVQYIGFFEALRDFVWGDGSMLYSFSRSLGGEMMGIYAYYLASPLSYIVALFPESMITEAILTIELLKVGLCGLTFGIYLESKQYARKTEVLLFSTLYALTSFAVVMQHNLMWTDCMILLPVLTLGIERLVKYRRFGLYVFALSLSLLSNFYIGYMSCIYTLLYFLYYFYGYTADGRNNPLREKGHYLKALFRMGFYSILSIGIAAIILLTVSYSLTFGKNDFTDPSYLPELQFNPLQFFAKLLPGVYDTVEPEGFPFVYCGTLTLLLLPLYFLNRRFSRQERLSGGILLLVFYVSMSVSSLDMLWHGGQAPNWLNYRYAFFLCFLLLVFASRALCRIKDISTRTVAAVAALILMLIGVLAAVNYDFVSPTALAVAAIFVVVSAALLIGMIRLGDGMRPLLSLLLALLVIAEVFYNGSVQLAALHENVGGSNRKNYQIHHDKYHPIVEYVHDCDPDFYRMEAFYRRVTNDPFELHYRGVSGSTSTLNEKTLSFLSRLGIQSGAHWSEHKGGTTAADALLGIRYIFTPYDAEPNTDYEKLEGAPEFVYRNPYALAIVNAVSPKVNLLSLGSIREPLARQNALIGAMLGGEAAEIFIPIKPTERTYDKVEVNYIDDENGRVYAELLSDYYRENQEAIERGDILPEDFSAPESGITFTVEAIKNGALYFYVPTEYKNEMTVYVDGVKRCTIFKDEEDYLQDLGNFTRGDVVTVELRMEKSAYFYYEEDADLFWQESESAMADCFAALGTNGMAVAEWSDTHIKGTLRATEDRTAVLTTIPYDEGWRVTVDGKSVEIYESLDALIAFDVTPGEHAIEFVYAPSCLAVGRAVSIVSLSLLVLLFVLDLLLRRGVIRLKEGCVKNLVAVFFSFEDKLPPEVNELDDEHMPPPPPRKQKKAEDDAAGKAEAEEIRAEENEDGE